MTLNAPETPDGPWRCVEARPELSQELLDRALVGWERFLASVREPTDD
ncbi:MULTISPECIES: hypothetical protein [unclassified Streptomyces]|nr:hypothetical protein [Streptomyces sp. NBC_00047]MCX5612252.1 hypothetical protein [Streptomyces sp. NBC_00047]